MKLKGFNPLAMPALFLLLLVGIAHADAISVDFAAVPDVLPAPPAVGAYFHATITNLTNHTVYFSSLWSPTIPGGTVCFPFNSYASLCNADSEYPLAALASVYYPWQQLGVLGFNNPPGLYTFTLNVYGNMTGAGLFHLLGSDTATVTILGTDAVPEPTTLLLVGSGLGAMAWMRRRKR